MTRASRLTAIALAALIGGAIGASAPAAAVASIEKPLHFDLGVVVPGSTASASRTIDVARDATVVSTTWTQTSDAPDVLWSTTLCGEGIGCLPLDRLDGTRLQAGDYALTVSIDVPSGSTETDFTASAGGALNLVEASPALAATGGAAPWAAAIVGAFTCALGAFLLIRPRSERAR